jgi:hypothetical protein
MVLVTLFALSALSPSQLVRAGPCLSHSLLYPQHMLYLITHNYWLLLCVLRLSVRLLAIWEAQWTPFHCHLHKRMLESLRSTSPTYSHEASPPWDWRKWANQPCARFRWLCDLAFLPVIFLMLLSAWATLAITLATHNYTFKVDSSSGSART